MVSVEELSEDVVSNFEASFLDCFHEVVEDLGEDILRVLMFPKLENRIVDDCESFILIECIVGIDKSFM